MTVERLPISGALVVSELVTRVAGSVGPVGEPREWFHHETFYGYTVKQARAQYRASLRRHGFVVAGG